MSQVAESKREVSVFWSQIKLSSAHTIRIASSKITVLKDCILERVEENKLDARKNTDDALSSISASSCKLVSEAASTSQALLREITGQGPKKTLQRGFAIVRSHCGNSVTRASQTVNCKNLEIEFQDGNITVVSKKHFIKLGPMVTQSFKQAHGVLQQHAQTLRSQSEPNIDDFLAIVTDSVQAYKVCQERIEAVEKALEKALGETQVLSKNSKIVTLTKSLGKVVYDLDDILL